MKYALLPIIILLGACSNAAPQKFNHTREPIPLTEVLTDKEHPPLVSEYGFEPATGRIFHKVNTAHNR